MDVTVYSSNKCSYCLKQKEWLKEMNIPFEEKGLEIDEEYRQEFIMLGGKSVPYTVIRDGGSVNKVSGFNQTKLEQLLGI